MDRFIRLWVGQLASTIGSYMTVFALMLWAWDITGTATSLTLVAFFSQLPRIAITPLAGIVVDRFPRKHLMVLGDGVAMACTLAFGPVRLLWPDSEFSLFHFNCAAGSQA